LFAFYKQYTVGEIAYEEEVNKVEEEEIFENCKESKHPIADIEAVAYTQQEKLT
jgi:hypothetical protein